MPSINREEATSLVSNLVIEDLRVFCTRSGLKSSGTQEKLKQDLMNFCETKLKFTPGKLGILKVLGSRFYGNCR